MYVRIRMCVLIYVAVYRMGSLHLYFHYLSYYLVSSILCMCVRSLLCATLVVIPKYSRVKEAYYDSLKLYTVGTCENVVYVYNINEFLDKLHSLA